MHVPVKKAWDIAKRQPDSSEALNIVRKQVSWLVPQESSECSFRCRNWWTESRCWQERKQKVYRADTKPALAIMTTDTVEKEMAVEI